MTKIADLHIHSRYSMATSKDGNTETIAAWAEKKGISFVGTGDVTHPGWREELREKLVMKEDGLYCLKDAPVHGRTPRFVVTGEISCIYKKNGKTRKVHNLVLLPGLEEAEIFSKKLEKIGNIHSDGRPILGLDSRGILEMILDVTPRGILIPAHIWTPHFSALGAKSGFDSIEECYGDLSPYIYALETGLSSDPPMNRSVPCLDKYFLVSNSDAHSPSKLGREATLFDIPFSYEKLYEAICTGKGLAGTLEFFPEEGKYHYDGHRKCGVVLNPKEAEAVGGICPVCKKPLTMGVAHRVQELSEKEKSNGSREKTVRPYESLVPLIEIVAACMGYSVASKRVQAQYEKMLETLGTEFEILREVPAQDIRASFGSLLGDAIEGLRKGEVKCSPGYDGEYGKISFSV